MSISSSIFYERKKLWNELSQFGSKCIGEKVLKLKKFTVGFNVLGILTNVFYKIEELCAIYSEMVFRV